MTWQGKQIDLASQIVFLGESNIYHPSLADLFISYLEPVPMVLGAYYLHLPFRFSPEVERNPTGLLHI